MRSSRTHPFNTTRHKTDGTHVSAPSHEQAPIAAAIARFDAATRPRLLAEAGVAHTSQLRAREIAELQHLGWSPVTIASVTGITPVRRQDLQSQAAAAA